MVCGPCGPNGILVQLHVVLETKQEPEHVKDKQMGELPVLEVILIRKTVVPIIVQVNNFLPKQPFL